MVFVHCLKGFRIPFQGHCPVAFEPGRVSAPVLSRAATSPSVGSSMALADAKAPSVASTGSLTTGGGGGGGGAARILIISRPFLKGRVKQARSWIW